MTSENQIALYRKYRPKKFSEVAGQDSIVKVLKHAIADKHIVHAYLFEGGRGIGKTTIARILAKEIGTTDKDIYEMDAASNRKIDDFRELNESVHTLPFESEYKVYIIDEVHMLTQQAFNAFLKTLEEPPKHVVFILATTEIQKLPDTIVSRCQTFTFNTPTRALVAKEVLGVAKKEGVVLESDAAELIAILSEGSFRDALGVLQKVLSYADDKKKITRSEVEAVTGAPRLELVNTTLKSISNGSMEDALSAISDAADSQTNFLTFEKLLLDRVRAVLLLRNAPHTKERLQQQFSDEDFSLLENLSKDKNTHINARTLLALLTAYTETSHAYIPHMPLEIAVVSLFKK